MSAAVAEKIEDTPRTITSRRFILPDWTDTQNWLLPRLKVKLPHLQDIQIHGWIRSITDAQEFMFIRTENAVACAQMVKDVMSSAPEVIERFVLAKDRTQPGQVEECQHLYADLFRWAQNVGARDMTIEQFTDVKHEDLATQFGRVFERETKFVRVAGKR